MMVSDSGAPIKDVSMRMRNGVTNGTAPSTELQPQLANGPSIMGLETSLWVKVQALGRTNR